jgi:hypothetical protein
MQHFLKYMNGNKVIIFLGGWEEERERVCTGIIPPIMNLPTSHPP